MNLDSDHFDELATQEKTQYILALAPSIFQVKGNDPLEQFKHVEQFKYYRVINCPEKVRWFEIKDTGKELNFYKRVAIFLLKSQTNGRECE